MGFKKELFEEEKNNSVMSYSDPFTQDNITEINFRYRRCNIFKEEINEFKATINFENGNTTGSHVIKASTFPELYANVINFCKGLRK